jgi:membrane protein
MGPLLLIVMAVAGLFLGADAVRGCLSAKFRSLLGETGSKAVEAMLAGAGTPQSGRLAVAMSVVLLVVAALGIVVQLKDAMNTIWEVEAPKDSGLWWYARTYLVSLAGIVGLGFMLVVSFVVSAGLAALSQWAGATYSSIGAVLDFVGSIAVLSGLFAMLFKLFPDTEIAWRDVVPGAIVTAILFTVGKLGIGWYIGTQGLESTYGAAASLVVLLIWVYYSAQIVLFGAELTRAYALVTGSHKAAPGTRHSLVR